MAFPTTPVLDDFNRANGTVGGNFSRIFSFSQAPSITSNEVQSPGDTGFADGVWTPHIYGPDAEVTLDVPTRGSGVVDLFARMVGSVDSYNGYAVQFTGLGAVKIYRFDAGSGTQLGADFTQAIASGDTVGLSVVGSTIEAWYKPSGGSWTSIGSRTDSTYTAAGRVGFFIEGNGGIRVDNFGGGTANDGVSGLHFIQQNASNGATTCQADFSASVAGGSGKCLVAHVFWQDTSSGCSLTDDAGNTWIPVGSPQNGLDSLASWRYQDFYCPDPVDGTTAVTATIGSANTVALYVAEYGGFTGTPTLDDNSYRSGPLSQSATHDSNPVTTTVADAVIVAGVFPQPGITSVNAPFTDLAPGGFAPWFNCGVGEYIASTVQTGLVVNVTLTSPDADVIGLMAIADVMPGVALEAVISCSAALASSLSVTKPLSSSISGGASVAAPLSVSRPLSVAVAGRSTVAAQLALGKPLAAAIAVTATLIFADLTGGAVVQYRRLRTLLGAGE